jgi:hypothetical protein
MLSLRAPWLWLAIGITSAPDGLQWWYAVALIAASWFVPEMRRPEATANGPEEAGVPPGEPLHPLAANLLPWGGHAETRSG